MLRKVVTATLLAIIVVFAVGLGSCQEASFKVSNLAIEPSSALAGETISVLVDVTNTGGAEGIYDVVLSVDDEEAASELIALAGGDSKTVTLELTADGPGEHEVKIAGLTGVFTVVDLDQIMEKAVTAISNVHSYHFTCTLEIEMSIPEDSMSFFDDFEVTP